MKHATPRPRVLYDVLGTNEAAVRCRCGESIVVVSLKAYVKLGYDEACKTADGVCPRCRA